MNPELESIIIYDEDTNVKYIPGDTYLENIDKFKDLSREEFKLAAEYLANAVIISSYFDIQQSIVPFTSAVMTMEWYLEIFEGKESPITKDKTAFKRDVYNQIDIASNLRVSPALYFSDYCDFKNGESSIFEFIWKIKSIYDIWGNDEGIKYIEDHNKYLDLISKLMEGENKIE